MLKPYAYPVKKAVWRLINSEVSYDVHPLNEPKIHHKKIVAELIGNIKITDNP